MLVGLAADFFCCLQTGFLSADVSASGVDPPSAPAKHLPAAFDRSAVLRQGRLGCRIPLPMKVQGLLSLWMHRAGITSDSGQKKAAPPAAAMHWQSFYKKRADPWPEASYAFYWSRVSSLNSYYLTSLINLSFYDFRYRPISRPQCFGSDPASCGALKSSGFVCPDKQPTVSRYPSDFTPSFFWFSFHYFWGWMLVFYLYIGITLSDYNLSQGCMENKCQY